MVLGLVFNADAGCVGVSAQATSRMNQFWGLCADKNRSETGNVAINDFSLTPPRMFIMDRSMNRCLLAVDISYGSGSKGNPPIPGNVYDDPRTPAGFHITRLHRGMLYGPTNSLGLAGTGSENSNSQGRAILIHAKEPGKDTIGCIGVPPGDFATVHKALSIGAVVYNHFPNHTDGDSVRKCDPIGGSDDNTGGSRGWYKGGRD